VGIVRRVRESEIDAWCACPLKEGNEGLAEWVEGERRWFSQWHSGPERLFVHDQDGDLTGKYDVPIERPRHWELWAPTVRDGPGADEVMGALCRHLLGEARRRRVESIEVILEEAHRHFPLARDSLLHVGFRLAEEKVVFSRDLSRPLPGADAAGVGFGEVAALDRVQYRRLCRAIGVSEEFVEPAGVVALVEGEAVGAALVSTKPGSETFLLHHLGLAEEAKGKGWGTALLANALERARAEGSSTYIGSTRKGNAAMLAVFERIGCERIGDRLVFHWRADESRHRTARG
jgi:GNAT superfamily N-acetyltransferase